MVHASAMRGRARVPDDCLGTSKRSENGLTKHRMVCAARIVADAFSPALLSAVYLHPRIGTVSPRPTTGKPAD
jgi:hypothetical protein